MTLKDSKFLDISSSSASLCRAPLSATNARRKSYLEKLAEKLTDEWFVCLIFHSFEFYWGKIGIKLLLFNIMRINNGEWYQTSATSWDPQTLHLIFFFGGSGLVSTLVSTLGWTLISIFLSSFLAILLWSWWWLCPCYSGLRIWFC